MFPLPDPLVMGRGASDRHNHCQQRPNKLCVALAAASSPSLPPPDIFVSISLEKSDFLTLDSPQLSASNHFLVDIESFFEFSSL